MTNDSLMQAWAWYCGGVAGLLLVWWRLLRPLPYSFLRRLLLLLMLVVALCPYSVGDGYTQMAPALLMLLLEAVFDGGDAYLRVGPTLLGLAIVALLVAGLLEWLLRKRRT